MHNNKISLSSFLSALLALSACSGSDDGESGDDSTSDKGSGGSASQTSASNTSNTTGTTGPSETSTSTTGNSTGGSSGIGGSGGTDASGGTDTSGSTAGSNDSGNNASVTTDGGGGSGPTPPSSWVNVTGNLAGMASECGNLTLVSAVPNSATVIAGVAAKGLYATDDGGENWYPLGTGAGSAVIQNRPSAIVYDPNHPGVFWESGIYTGGGVFKTVDGGETFEQLGDIGHNDLVSVDFSDPERKTLLAGGHEQKQTLYLSQNGGESFEQIGQNLPADAHFSSAPLVLDAETFLLGACGWGDGQCGIYRSEDAGQSWDLVSDVTAAARPLWASDGSIYWPLIFNGGLVRGTSDGTDWSSVGGSMVSWPPVELADGRILQVQGNRLVLSADQGASWDEVGEPLPFEAAGVSFSPRRKTVFVWHWDCGDVVLSDAIASAGFDPEAL